MATKGRLQDKHILKELFLTAVASDSDATYKSESGGDSNSDVDRQITVDCHYKISAFCTCNS
jgi:hypothetical protein